MDRFVGISLRIRYSQDAADNIKDISKMKPNPPIGGTLQFDYPCMNCRSLIHINGWNESIFHEFLRDVMEMPEPKKNSSLLQEYVVSVHPPGAFSIGWLTAVVRGRWALSAIHGLRRWTLNRITTYGFSLVYAIHIGRSHEGEGGRI